MGDCWVSMALGGTYPVKRRQAQERHIRLGSNLGLSLGLGLRGVLFISADWKSGFLLRQLGLLSGLGLLYGLCLPLGILPRLGHLVPLLFGHLFSLHVVLFILLLLLLDLVLLSLFLLDLLLRDILVGVVLFVHGCPVDGSLVICGLGSLGIILVGELVLFFQGLVILGLDLLGALVPRREVSLLEVRVEVPLNLADVARLGTVTIIGLLFYLLLLHSTALHALLTLLSDVEPQSLRIFSHLGTAILGLVSNPGHLFKLLLLGTLLLLGLLHGDVAGVHPLKSNEFFTAGVLGPLFVFSSHVVAFR